MAYQKKFFDITIFSPQLPAGKPIRFRYATGKTAVAALTSALREVFGTGLKLAGSIKTLEVKVRRREISDD